MYYVYILKSKVDSKLYVGYTSDLKKRLIQHNKKQNTSTKCRAPFKLVYAEIYRSQSDALAREKNLKLYSKAYKQLKRRISESII